jgi:hypothetical protein
MVHFIFYIHSFVFELTWCTIYVTFVMLIIKVKYCVLACFHVLVVLVLVLSQYIDKVAVKF